MTALEQSRPHDWMAAQAMGWGPPPGPRRHERVSRRFKLALALALVILVGWAITPLLVSKSSGLARSPVGPVLFCPVHQAVTK
jgi:hypothetical protein